MSSDSEEENNIRFGTPLDPYEEDEVPSKRKYQEQPDQYAVDSHGRRRFHGAFTGGFSAGFGNSVSTPEGWTPTTFKSSRAEKAALSSQRPEDFMDEEDRSEFGIAPRLLQTKNDFSGQKRPRAKQFHDGPIPGEPVLEQLLKPIHETAAVKMVKRMGWKEGQGIGDRVSKKEKKEAEDRHKVYGCFVPPELRQSQTTQQSEEEDSSDAEIDYDQLFAPADYEPYILHQKNDRFGLGYSGLSRHSILGNLVGSYGESSSSSHLLMKDKGKKVSIRGQAFGVGAMEDEDEDIYGKEDMSHYDFAIGGPREEKTKDKKKVVTKNVLEGFTKASKPMPSVPSYPPPALPRDYRPVAAGFRRSRFEPTQLPERAQGLGRHELSAEARGKMLGEEPIPTNTNAEEVVVDKAQTKPQDDPIAKLLGRNVNFVSNSTSTSEEQELNFISIKDSGKPLKKVFKPFKSNPEKQKRYEKFLEDKNSVVSEREGDTDRLTEWERNREFIEFEQAAKLYTPLTGVMGDRFTHGSEPDDSLNPLTAVAKSSISYGLTTQEQIDAAEKGLYGVMTRTKADWRPEALVCKRFNIPEPYGAKPQDPKKDVKSRLSYSIFAHLEDSAYDKDSFTKEQSKFSGSRSLNVEPKRNIIDNINKTNKTPNANTEPKPSTSNEIETVNKRLTVAELFLKESEKAVKANEISQVTETINKFDKMDLYKSIFLSDSEEEDLSKTDNDSKNNNKNVDDINSGFIVKPQNIERNTSPPRGIFANIDFDEINSWRRNTDKDRKSDNTNESSNNTDNNTKNKISDIPKKDTDETFGPKIPDELLKRLQSACASSTDTKPVYKRKEERDKPIEIGSSSSSDSWVEASEVSKKHKKKKRKKSKSKNKKSKHKKKR